MTRGGKRLPQKGGRRRGLYFDSELSSRFMRSTQPDIRERRVKKKS